MRYTSHNNGLPCGINLQVPKLCRVGNTLAHLRLYLSFVGIQAQYFCTFVVWINYRVPWPVAACVIN